MMRMGSNGMNVKNMITVLVQRVHNRLLLAFAATAVGCAVVGSAVAANITGYNYTDEQVSAFTVNGYSGPNIYPHNTGGFVCCISIPEQWKQGMTVTIKWTAHRNANPIPWKTQVVEVPRYTRNDISRFAVHFFPNDVVKVLVTKMGPGHPEYPYPMPSAGGGKQ